MKTYLNWSPERDHFYLFICRCISNPLVTNLIIAFWGTEPIRLIYLSVLYVFKKNSFMFQFIRLQRNTMHAGVHAAWEYTKRKQLTLATKNTIKTNYIVCFSLANSIFQYMSTHTIQEEPYVIFMPIHNKTLFTLSESINI